MPSGKKRQQARGLPLRTGKRKGKIAAYFEVTYPYRKLLRMHNNGASIAALKAWADSYKTPMGVSGNAALVRLGKKFSLNVSQVG